MHNSSWYSILCKQKNFNKKQLHNYLILWFAILILKIVLVRLSNKPEIDSCLTRAISLHGKQALSLSGTSITSECSLQKDFYGKFQVDRMQIDLTSHFKVAIYDYLKSRRPKFVPEELFGVVGVYLEMHKVSVTGEKKYKIWKETLVLILKVIVFTEGTHSYRWTISPKSNPFPGISTYIGKTIVVHFRFD